MVRFRRQVNRSAHLVNPARLAGPAANPGPDHIDPGSARVPAPQPLGLDSHSRRAACSHPAAHTSVSLPEEAEVPDLVAAPEVDPVAPKPLAAEADPAIATAPVDPAAALVPAGPATVAAGPAAAPIRRAPARMPSSAHTPCARQSLVSNASAPNSHVPNFPAKSLYPCLSSLDLRPTQGPPTLTPFDVRAEAPDACISL
jgi:hypothetical protein